MEEQVVNKAAEAATAVATDPSFLKAVAVFMDEGGIFMWIILVIWTFGIAIAVERVKSLFSYDVDGTSLMNMVKKNVMVNDVQKAIQSCSNSKALLPMVLKSGLKRANQSKEQISDAIISESRKKNGLPRTRGERLDSYWSTRNNLRSDRVFCRSGNS
jgi:biopolymer transport protein ExbB/TolQ